MIKKRCLFHEQSNNCNEDFSTEHIIQRGLGGTISSNELICSNCNNYFSSQIDSKLINFYIPIREILIPLMSGGLVNKKRYVDAVEEPLQLAITDGGKIDLKGIKKTYDENGDIIRLDAPGEKNENELLEIARAEGMPIDPRKIAYLPITKAFRIKKIQQLLEVNEDLYRAILLDLFELMKYGTIKKVFPNLFEKHSLQPITDYIRNGKSEYNSFFHGEPYADISDIIEGLFNPCIFFHRLMVNYDSESECLFFIAQFFNTMPWLFILRNVDLKESSVSLLYQKDLLDNKDQFKVIDRSVLDVKKIEWRRFTTSTKNAIEFARLKMMQDYYLQYSRAFFELNMRDDETVFRNLLRHIKNCYKIDINQIIEAIVKSFEWTYQNNNYKEDILEAVKSEASLRFKNLKENDHDCCNEVLKVYRCCFNYIVNKKEFGFPNLMEKIE